jgi:hypothetical protein
MKPNRRFCRCRRYCPGGNVVSYRTFARHQRQERLDREQSNDSSDSSDADDENSDSEGCSVASIEPLIPMALPELSAEPAERGSVVPREFRTASPRSVRESLSVTPSTEQGDSQHSDAAQNYIQSEPGEEELSSDPPMTTPGATESPPGTSPPGSSSEEGPPFENIEEAIFSNFDIEDLLFASRIELQPWLRLGIVLLRWKSRKNISTHAFDELRHDLAQCVGMKVPSSSVIIRHLQEIVGFHPRKIDCCGNGCLAYVGRYRKGKKCAICGQKRYQLDLPGDEDVPDLDLEDSDLSDEELDQNIEVCFRAVPQLNEAG